MSGASFEITVCRGPTCAGKRGADEVHEALAAQVAEHGLGERITLDRRLCFGRCAVGPNVLVRTTTRPEGEPGPRAALYNHVTAADARAIVEEHVLAGTFLERLIAPPPRPPEADGEVRLAVLDRMPEID